MVTAGGARVAQEAYLAALSQPRHEHRVDDRLLGLVESGSMQEGGQLPAGQLDELRAERAASRRPLAFALVSRAVRLPPCLLPNDPCCEAACPDSATFGRSGELSGCHPFCSWGAVSWVCGLQEAPHILLCCGVPWVCLPVAVSAPEGSQ